MVAFADMVMMALRKSPADVWVEVVWSGARKEIKRGTRFCCCNHCPSVSVYLCQMGQELYINNTVAPLALLETDNLQQEVHDDRAVDVLEHVRDDIGQRFEKVEHLFHFAV